MKSAVDSKRRRGQSQTNRDCKLRTCRRWALVKAQRCPEHSANTRRRIVVKSEPAVTTQEAVDGDREKAMTASVEQIELGNVMELSITGQVLKWARRSNLSGGLSLRKADGWNSKSHSHLTVARHLREKTHPACWSGRSGKVKNEESAVQR